MSKSHLIVAGALLVAGLWLFGPALAGRASFAFRDAAHFYHPLFELVRAEWGAGRVPLWNPYESTGLPLAAENTSSVFYPGQLLFVLPLDYTLLYNLYVVGHLALAAVTSFRLARHFAASVPAAGLAALSYALGGNVLFQTTNVPFLVGAAWLPWALQLADRSLRERSPRAATGMGVVLALMITGGDPQMAVNAGLAATLNAWLLWRGDARERAVALSAKKVGLSRNRFSLLALAAGVCGLLAAVQIAPSIEAARRSARASYDAPRSLPELLLYRPPGAELAEGEVRPAWYEGLLSTIPGGHSRQLYEFSVGPWRAIELFWPNIAGRQFPTHRRWMSGLKAEGRVWVPSLYLGLLPVLLAAVTWSVRRRASVEVRWWSWIALAGSLASLGGYGLVWLVRDAVSAFGGPQLPPIGDEVGGLYWLLTIVVPGYVYFRYPAKLLVLANLAISLLAARGWDNLAERRVALRRLLVALSGASLLLLVTLIAAWRWLAPTLSEIPADILFGPFDVDGASRDVAGASLQTLILSLLLWAVLRKHGMDAGVRWSAAAVLLTTIDLLVAQAWMVPLAPAELWQSEPAVASTLPADRDPYRIHRAGPRHPREWHETTSPDRIVEVLRWERSMLRPLFNLPLRVSLVEGSGSIVPHDFQMLLEVAEQQARQGGARGGLPEDMEQIDSSVLDLLAARYTLRSGEPDRAESPAQLVPRPGALPRAWIVHSAVTLPPLDRPTTQQLRERTRKILFRDGQPREWRRVAVIETDQSLSLPDVNEPPLPEGESCQIVSSDPQRVELLAVLARPGLVVLSDLDYPGWQCSIETSGASSAHLQTILRANRTMRAVLVPAGQHRITLCYRPTSFYTGAAISLSGVIILVVLSAFAWRERTRRA